MVFSVDFFAWCLSFNYMLFFLFSLVCMIKCLAITRGVDQLSVCPWSAEISSGKKLETGPIVDDQGPFRQYVHKIFDKWVNLLSAVDQARLTYK